MITAVIGPHISGARALIRVEEDKQVVKMCGLPPSEGRMLPEDYQEHEEKKGTVAERLLRATAGQPPGIERNNCWSGAWHGETSMSRRPMASAR